MNTCIQCGSKAFTKTSSAFGEGYLCFDHNTQHIKNMATINDQNQRMVDYLGQEMEYSAGIRQDLPKMRDANGGNTIVNNNSAQVSFAGHVGLVNVGQIEKTKIHLNQNVQSLFSKNEDDIAKSIEKITQAILESKEVDEKQKSKMLEITNLLSEQVLKQKEIRSFSTAEWLVESLKLLSHALPFVNTVIEEGAKILAKF